MSCKSDSHRWRPHIISPWLSVFAWKISFFFPTISLFILRWQALVDRLVLGMTINSLPPKCGCSTERMLRYLDSTAAAVCVFFTDACIRHTPLVMIVIVGGTDSRMLLGNPSLGGYMIPLCDTSTIIDQPTTITNNHESSKKLLLFLSQPES